MSLLSKEILVVAIGGAFGSVMRLLLSRFVQVLIPYEALPWGIIICNVLGCYVIGALFVLFQASYFINPLWRVGLVVGVLGGFTTFSSFSLDTIVFLQKAQYVSAVENICLSLVLCLLGTTLGMYTVASLFK